MKKTTDATPDIDGAFLKTMQTHQKGKTISDISAALRRVTEQVNRIAKPGKVIVTLTVAPATKGQESAMGFSVDVTERPPKEIPYAGLFFVDDNNNLVRENPRQPEMPQMRVIEGAKAEDKPQLRKVQEAQI